MIEAYPLHWPIDYPRSSKQKDSRFKITLGAARDYVKEEIRMLEGSDPVISTNIPLKNNGELRADWSHFKLDDSGVAVYFNYKGNQVCLCCDTYKRVWENLYAVGRTIKALRQINRDGVSDFLNRTFSGFKSIPEKAGNGTNAWMVLGIDKTTDASVIKKAYREKIKHLHPDRNTGDNEMFIAVTQARDEALKFTGL